jgi:hypothetical protein
VQAQNPEATLAALREQKTGALQSRTEQRVTASKKERFNGFLFVASPTIFNVIRNHLIRHANLSNK